MNLISFFGLKVKPRLMSPYSSYLYSLVQDVL